MELEDWLLTELIDDTEEGLETELGDDREDGLLTELWLDKDDGLLTELEDILLEEFSVSGLRLTIKPTLRNLSLRAMYEPPVAVAYPHSGEYCRAIAIYSLADAPATELYPSLKVGLLLAKPG